MRRAHLLTAALAVVPALALPSGAGAAASCSFDAPTATVQVQMLSARVVVGRAGAGILVDGRTCAASVNAARRIVVASDFPPAADTVVVDESHGRVPTVFALTGPGGDTMEVIGTPGADHYIVHDALGASIDLDTDVDPVLISTDVARVVLFGKGGDDHLDASPALDDRASTPVEFHGGRGDDVLRGGRSGDDRVDGGPGNDRVLARDAAGDRLAGGRGFDTVRADAGDTATGFERGGHP